MATKSQVEFARVLDDEFKRVARDEHISMAQLIADVAGCIGVGERHIYRYRSGKWPLPAQLVPALCTRFRSRALMIALESEMADIPVVELSQDTDYAVMAIGALGEAVELVAGLVQQWKSADVDRIGLNRLQESTHRVISRYRMLFALLEQDRQRRRELRQGQ